MFWGVLICILAAGVFGANRMMDGIELMAIYTDMGIGIGIGAGTATVIFALGAGVVSAMDYARKRNAS